jgi:hypothetical protein
MIPDITTGMSDFRAELSVKDKAGPKLRWLAFMIRSGRNVPTPAIPMPDLAVPNAAPIPEIISKSYSSI